MTNTALLLRKRAALIDAARDTARLAARMLMRDQLDACEELIAEAAGYLDQAEHLRYVR